ncbi:MAG: ABC transporter substrate-binding protein [Anaerolineae bacterium]
MKKNLFILLVIIAVAMLAVPTAVAAPPVQDGGQDYIVVADDWLSKLSDKFLGDVLAYPAITHYTNQKNKEDSSYAKITNSDLIEVGWKIYIPSSEEAQAYFAGQVAKAGASGGDTVKIGALAPLSAPGSVTGGGAMKAAFEIAVEEINAAGGVLGKPVELILVDTEGLPERGTAAMERLINQEGVVGVVGEYHSAVGLTAKEVAHVNGIPTIFAETWNDKITNVQYPEVFRIAPVSSVVSAVDAEFVASLGFKKVVIMSENTGYGIPAAADTEKFLAEKGIEAVSFFADLGTQDFSGIVERVKAENPDLIWVLSTGETSYNFEQQAAEAGIGPQDIPMVCNQVAGDSEAYWANVPDGNLCFYRRIGLPKAKYTEATTAFETKYIEKTGKSSAESYAMEAYDSLKLMAQAINEAGSTDPQAIISALEATSYNGVLGTITFPYGTHNPIPDGVDAKWWHQFPNPAITIVQYTEPGQLSSDAATVFPETYKTADPVLP